MTSRHNWKTGASTSFYRDYSPERLQEYAAAGLDCLELSYNWAYFDEIVRLIPEPERVKAEFAAAGITPWSIHLPFSNTEAISLADDTLRGICMEHNRQLIRAAGKAGIAVAVVHPSTEPIADEERPAELRRSRESLIELAAIAGEHGVKLAVENLPRTCLCHNIEETLWTLDRIENLYLTFDTNHLVPYKLPKDALEQKMAETTRSEELHTGLLLPFNPPKHPSGEQVDMDDLLAFIRAVGSHVLTLHVSDYDFIDERHLLPGDGQIDWQALIAALEAADYAGPWMYELGFGCPKSIDRRRITTADFRANYDALMAGEKPEQLGTPIESVCAAEAWLPRRNWN